MVGEGAVAVPRDQRRALAPDGRDPARVPADWRDLLDAEEWRLGAEGLPFRRAARVIALREDPEPGILLVLGHDFADTAHSWAFTPGGGIADGEEPGEAALRELEEETGIALAPGRLIGPVAERSSLFRFNLVTCRQDEVIFLARLERADTDPLEGAGGELDRAGWTEQEREVLDSLRWWGLDELDRAVAGGMTVYPEALPHLARELMAGWDGAVRDLGDAGEGRR